MFLNKKNYHQQSVSIMAQGFLPFKYEVEKKTTGNSPGRLAGLP
jgi:hypothetical protein